jgi:hypothetical protein
VEMAKVVIFVVFFGLFLLLSRKLFSSQTTYNPSDLPPAPYLDPPASGSAGPGSITGSSITPGFPMEDERKNQPVLVGAELPFPVSLPPREAGPDGKYNRPLVLNYYFKKLDLLRGPEDPRCFCDEFFIELEAPETRAVWTNEYIVATPAGLQQLLDAESHDSLLFDAMLIVVPKWNVANLLKIIMDEVMEAYRGSEAPKEDSKKKDAERYWL